MGSGGAGGNSVSVNLLNFQVNFATDSLGPECEAPYVLKCVLTTHHTASQRTDRNPLKALEGPVQGLYKPFKGNIGEYI